MRIWVIGIKFHFCICFHLYSISIFSFLGNSMAHLKALKFALQSLCLNENMRKFIFCDNFNSLTALISKWQIFSTRTKLSFGLTPMANQTYPQDGLMCGVKLWSGDHSQRIGGFKIFPDFWKKFWKSSVKPSEKSMVWFFVTKPFLSL